MHRSQFIRILCSTHPSVNTSTRWETERLISTDVLTQDFLYPHIIS